MKYDITGIGNAIVDVLVNESDAFLAANPGALGNPFSLGDVVDLSRFGRRRDDDERHIETDQREIEHQRRVHLEPIGEQDG